MVLGEIIRRVDGRPFDRYIRDEIFLPLGMPDCYIGMRSDEFSRYGGRIGGLWSTGLRSKDGGLLEESAVCACVPGGNLRGPSSQVLRLFRALLEGGRIGAGATDSARVLSESTAKRLCSRRRLGMFDAIQGITCDWGLGLFVGAFKFTGEHASRDTFGHGGSQSSLGFGDPVHGIAASVVFNMRPGSKQNEERMHRVTTALYEDFNLNGRSCCSMT